MRYVCRISKRARWCVFWNAFKIGCNCRGKIEFIYYEVWFFFSFFFFCNKFFLPLIQRLWSFMQKNFLRTNEEYIWHYKFFCSIFWLKWDTVSENQTSTLSILTHSSSSLFLVNKNTKNKERNISLKLLEKVTQRSLINRPGNQISAS